MWVDTSDEALRRVIACGLEAARQHRPFWAFVQKNGIDSWVADGLLGTPEGVVEEFFYDSDPSGGSGHPSRFTTRRCGRPVINTDPRYGTTFACGQ